MVSHDVINAILLPMANDSGAARWGGKKFEELGHALGSNEGIQRLGQELHGMNVQALIERYGDSAEKETKFHFRPERKQRTKVETYKQIRCLLYQCSEGDVPEYPLFEALEHYAKWMADEIVKDLPAYERAPWG